MLNVDDDDAIRHCVVERAEDGGVVITPRFRHFDRQFFSNKHMCIDWKDKVRSQIRSRISRRTVDSVVLILILILLLALIMVVLMVRI